VHIHTLVRKEKNKEQGDYGKNKHALVPSPKQRTDTKKDARAAGKATVEREENAGTRGRAEMKNERRECV
jgi:DUF1009 family protein